MRERANLCLPQPGFDQRAAHVQFFRRLTAGAIISNVVGVIPVAHEGVTAPGGERREFREQLVFAEVAAIRRVSLIVRIVDFVGADELVRDRKSLDYGEGVLALEIRVARALAGHSQSAQPELIGGGIGEIGAVDAARESDYHRPHLAQDAAKLLLFETEGRGDGETRGQGDKGKRGRGERTCLLVSLSPCPLVPLSLNFHLCGLFYKE